MYFNGFLCYDREQKKFQASVWRKKKDTVIYVFQRFSLLRPEKKSSSRLSGEKKKIQLSVKKKFQSSVRRKKKDTVVYVFQRVSSLRPEKKKFQSSVWRKKKDTVICLLGARFWRLHPEKKDTVVCSICISST